MSNAEKLREKRKTPKYRALYLLSGYRRQDRLYNRGECTLTQQDIFDLWEQGCNWCGETDWHKLGADRIDNSKPHTKDNCVCACWSCNAKRGANRGGNNKKAVVQYTLDGQFVAEYESTVNAQSKTGINQSSISKCCNNKFKTAGGFIWKYNK